MRWLIRIIVKFIPEWFPGADFKRRAADWRRTAMRAVDEPYSFVLAQMEKGVARSSYVKYYIEKFNGPLTAEDEYVCKWSAAALYTAGADTSVISLAMFFLAMALYPEAQKAAKDEIDPLVPGVRADPGGRRCPLEPPAP